MGEKVPATDELRNALTRLPKNSGFLVAQIAAFLLGELTEDALLAIARTPGERDVQWNLCDVHFYFGVVRLIGGDTAGARSHLLKARQTNCKELYDWTSAGAELRNLGT